MHKSKASNQPKFQYIASAVKEEKKRPWERRLWAVSQCPSRISEWSLSKEPNDHPNWANSPITCKSIKIFPDVVANLLLWCSAIKQQSHNILDVLWKWKKLPYTVTHYCFNWTYFSLSKAASNLNISKVHRAFSGECHRVSFPPNFFPCPLFHGVFKLLAG